jgi:hypothetical protein
MKAVAAEGMFFDQSHMRTERCSTGCTGHTGWPAADDHEIVAGAGSCGVQAARFSGGRLRG